MKKILFSLAFVGIIAGLVGGATWAFYTDTTTVDKNTLSTGSVTLGSTHNLPFEIENLAPGGEFSTDLAIQYEGSLPADLYIGVKEEGGMDLGPLLQYKLERMKSGWEHDGWIVGSGGSDGWEDIDGHRNPIAQWIKTHKDLEKGDWARARLHIRMKDGNDSVEFEDGVHWNDFQNMKESITLIMHAIQAGGTPDLGIPRDYNPQITNIDRGETYSSISAAIEDAEVGQTILVPQGVYEEEVVLDKNGLTLKFYSKYGGTATIQSDTAAQEGVIAITANNVTLDGFTIDNLDPNDEDDNRAVRVKDDTSGTVIANNTFNNSRRGVQANWTGGDIGSAEITGNTFNTGFGLAGTEEWKGLYVAGNVFNSSEEAIGVGVGVEFIDHDSNPLAEGDDIEWLRDNNEILGAGDVEDYR